MIGRPFVEENKSRHGLVRYYFRQKGVGRVRLPDPIANPDLFETRYQQCFKQIHMREKPRQNVKDGLKPKIKSRKHNPTYRIIWMAKARAKEKNRSFNISAEWLLTQLQRQDFCCAVTGIRMTAFDDPTYARSPYKPSIDRINNAGGYTRDNCRVVILALNLALNLWGLEVLTEVAEKLLAGTSGPHLDRG